MKQLIFLASILLFFSQCQANTIPITGVVIQAVYAKKPNFFSEQQCRRVFSNDFFMQLAQNSYSNNSAFKMNGIEIGSRKSTLISSHLSKQYGSSASSQLRIIRFSFRFANAKENQGIFIVPITKGFLGSYVSTEFCDLIVKPIYK